MTSDLHVQNVAPHELSLTDIADWQLMCDAEAHNTSPLLSPEFALLISRVRSDVRCILARNSTGRLIAAMALHVRPGGLARPIGAPFDDYSGPIFSEHSDALCIRRLLEAANIPAYRAAHMIAPSASSTLLSEPLTQSYMIELGDNSPAEYLETRRQKFPKRFKNFRRLMRKLDKDVGPIVFSYGAPQKDNLEQLMRWKRAQFRDDALVDLTTCKLSKAIIEAVKDEPYTEENHFGGYMTTLSAGGQLVSGHFGLRRGAHFHPWIAAYDPAFHLYMPGIQLFSKIIEAMPEMELCSYDLSDGHGHYKKYFTDTGRAVQPIVYSNRSFTGNFQHARFAAWKLLGAGQDTSIAARLRRRFDHIACCDDRLGKRVSEVAYAIARRR